MAGHFPSPVAAPKQYIHRSRNWHTGQQSVSQDMFAVFDERVCAFTQTDFDAIADELNNRPRQTLEFATSSEQLAQLFHLR